MHLRCLAPKYLRLLEHCELNECTMSADQGFTFTFTFMHLADAFIQSDLHCIQVTVFTFLSALAFPGNRTHDLGVASAMLYYLSYRKACRFYGTFYLSLTFTSSHLISNVPTETTLIWNAASHPSVSLSTFLVYLMARCECEVKLSHHCVNCYNKCFCCLIMIKSQSVFFSFNIIA